MRVGIVLLLLLQAFQAKALTVAVESVMAALSDADWVGDIAVRKVEYLADRDFSVRWIATSEVTRSERELSAGTEIRIRGIGGEFKGSGVFYTGLPRAYVGRRYHAYLKHVADDLYEVTGLEFGLQPIGAHRSFSRNRTDGSDGSGSGAFLHWDRNFFPIPYYIGLPGFLGRQDFVAAIDASFRTWRLAPNTFVDFLGMGCSQAAGNENDGTNQILYKDDVWLFDSSIIALTRNFFIGGQSSRAGTILDSDILINAIHHRFTTTGEAGKHDLQNILTHEIGHILGLGHEVAPIDSEATMFGLAIAGETKKRTLETNDIRGLWEGYLGNSDKLGSQSISCDVGTTGAGCAVVPGKRPSPFQLFYLLFIPAILWIGRRSRPLF